MRAKAIASATQHPQGTVPCYGGSSHESVIQSPPAQLFRQLKEASSAAVSSKPKLFPESRYSHISPVRSKKQMDIQGTQAAKKSPLEPKTLIKQRNFPRSVKTVKADDDHLAEPTKENPSTTAEAKHVSDQTQKSFSEIVGDVNVEESVEDEIVCPLPIHVAPSCGHQEPPMPDIQSNYETDHGNVIDIFITGEATSYDRSHTDEGESIEGPPLASSDRGIQGEEFLFVQFVITRCTS